MKGQDAAADRVRNQLELVARWADELAHEVKNPFHAMLINLELVKRRAGEDGDAARERAEVVESELQRVHGLIDSLLRLIRPWPAAEKVNVGTVLDALLPAFRARASLHHIELDYENDAGPAGVPIPPADLALLLLNLVDNAIDAAREAGEAPRVRIRCAREDDAVILRVTDNGGGVSDPDGAFASGVGREGRGGLGLAVSRGLVEAGGGTLTLEPNPEGPGATARATFPPAAG